MNLPATLLLIGGGAVLVWTGLVDPPGGATGLLGAALRGEPLPKPKPPTSDKGLLAYLGDLVSGSGSGGTQPASYSGTGAGAAISLARSQVGTREGAGNSQKYSHDLGRPSEAWCADFVCWVMKNSGNDGAVPSTASAPGMAQAFGSRFKSGSAGIRAGDVVFYSGASNGWHGIGHVGIAVSDGPSWQSVEGNYGDHVALNTRISCRGHATPNYGGGGAKVVPAASGSSRYVMA